MFDQAKTFKLNILSLFKNVYGKPLSRYPVLIEVKYCYDYTSGTRY